jgi:hypothetical protein
MKEDKKKKVEQEVFFLERYITHNFELASYLDIETGLKVINNFLVMSQYCIDDCTEMFIFNEHDLKKL